MATLKDTESATVWHWVAYRLLPIVASFKPQHCAADIQMAVAGNGNPAGG